MRKLSHWQWGDSDRGQDAQRQHVWIPLCAAVGLGESCQKTPTLPEKKNSAGRRETGSTSRIMHLCPMSNSGRNMSGGSISPTQTTRSDSSRFSAVDEVAFAIDDLLVLVDDDGNQDAAEPLVCDPNSVWALFSYDAARPVRPGRSDEDFVMFGEDSARYASIDQAAAWSGMSARSLRRLVANGTLVPFRPLKRRVLIDLRQLDCVIRGAANSTGTRGRRVQDECNDGVRQSNTDSWPRPCDSTGGMTDGF